MIFIINFLNALRSKMEGASLAEYALLLAIIAVVVVAVIIIFREAITGVFNDATTALQS